MIGSCRSFAIKCRYRLKVSHLVLSGIAFSSIGAHLSLVPHYLPIKSTVSVLISVLTFVFFGSTFSTTFSSLYARYMTNDGTNIGKDHLHGTIAPYRVFFRSLGQVNDGTRSAGGYAPFM